MNQDERAPYHRLTHSQLHNTYLISELLGNVIGFLLIANLIIWVTQ